MSVHQAFSTAVLIAFASLAGACEMELLNVEVTVDELCITDMEFELIANDFGLATESHLEEGEFLDNLESFDLDVRLTGVGIHAGEGLDDLDFIDSISLDLSTGEEGTTLDPVRLVSFQREFEVGDTLFIETDVDQNLVDYLGTGSLNFDTVFGTDSPDLTWTVDLDVCFSVSGSYGVGL